VAPEDQPPDEHQVGITNAQENNPNPIIADLTGRMNGYFAAGQYAESAEIALQITALSKDELRDAFERHGVLVLYLDHEAFGIYAGQIEPSYDTLVDGPTPKVLAAAAEFGRRHAQEAVLIARKLREGENDSSGRLGLTIVLGQPLKAGEAVRIAELARLCGFLGATFAPNRMGSMVVYHTETLNMTEEEFEEAAVLLIQALTEGYPKLQFQVQKFIIQMPRL
jgi:hypothetical protein